jgi:hypothetical protein
VYKYDSNIVLFARHLFTPLYCYLSIRYPKSTLLPMQTPTLYIYTLLTGAITQQSGDPISPGRRASSPFRCLANTNRMQISACKWLCSIASLRFASQVNLKQPSCGLRFDLCKGFRLRAGDVIMQILLHSTRYIGNINLLKRRNYIYTTRS